MTYRNNFTQKIVIGSAITMSFVTTNPVNAADFNIGNVKRTFPTDAFCVSFNPKMSNNTIVVDLYQSAWININGKDIELKSLGYKKINPKISISKFQGKGFTVTIKRQLISVHKGEMLESSDYQEVITIKRGNTSKVFQVKGYCSS
jgi:hypothetical protein